MRIIYPQAHIRIVKFRREDTPVSLLPHHRHPSAVTKNSSRLPPKSPRASNTRPSPPSGPHPSPSSLQALPPLRPLFSLRLGPHACVVASTPETAKEFLKTHELSFSDRPQSKAVFKLSYGSTGLVFAPYSSYWRYTKKLLITRMLNSQTLEQLMPVRHQEIMRLTKTSFAKSEKGEEVNMGAELLKLTNNVISRMAMSQTCSATDLEAIEARKIVE